MQISLYYHPLCPFSKQLITLLTELGLKYNLVNQDYWKPTNSFIDLSPWGELPVMVIDDTTIIAGCYPCIEYLIDSNRDFWLFNQDSEMMARIRQIINWFNKHFYQNVSKHFIDERLIKLDLKTQYPDTNIIRKAKAAFSQNMAQLTAIISLQEYLASETLTFADIAAASHLAVLDYFQDINWQQYPKVKSWYCLIKSRPAFRATLKERVKNITPPAHYLELDF